MPALTISRPGQVRQPPFARIASGQYGQCEQCHGRISAALLARQPQIRYCASCDCLAP